MQAETMRRRLRRSPRDLVGSIRHYSRPPAVAARSRENWQRHPPPTGAQKKAIDRRSAKPSEFDCATSWPVNNQVRSPAYLKGVIQTSLPKLVDAVAATGRQRVFLRCAEDACKLLKSLVGEEGLEPSKS